MRRNFVFALTIMLCSLLAAAQSGTTTVSNWQWNGLTRTYAAYTPIALGANPPKVVCLHGTAIAGAAAPPTTTCVQGMNWNGIADMAQIVVAAPMSTWKPNPKGPGWWFWESYGTDSFFPGGSPDDSGALRALILLLNQQYGSGPVYVVGFSSGGMMVHRFCAENSDLVAACSALSGSLWIGADPGIAPPAYPVPFLELHGDADPTVPFCGGPFANGWGTGAKPVASIDQDLAFWAVANGTPAPSSLCTNGAPNGLLGFDLVGTAELRVVVEHGFPHNFRNEGFSMIPAVWEFFAAHGGRQP